MESLSNPVRKVNKPKLPGGRTRRLEGDEEERLLEHCSIVFGRLVRFALETAIRREEISVVSRIFRTFCSSQSVKHGFVSSLESSDLSRYFLVHVHIPLRAPLLPSHIA